MGKEFREATANVITPATENKDSVTDAFKIIQSEHSEIHESTSYEHTDVVDQTINYVYDIQITTPNTAKWIHFTFEFDVEAETDWYFYENVNIITPGTAITPLNHDRNSINTSGVIVKVIANTTIGNANSDTAVAAATTLAHGIAGAGKKVFGQGGSRHEWMLKQNEDYSLRFIATAAGFVSFHLDWYEHTSM